MRLRSRVSLFGARTGLEAFEKLLGGEDQNSAYVPLLLILVLLLTLFILTCTHTRTHTRTHSLHAYFTLSATPLHISLRHNGLTIFRGCSIRIMRPRGQTLAVPFWVCCCCVGMGVGVGMRGWRATSRTGTMVSIHAPPTQWACPLPIEERKVLLIRPFHSPSTTIEFGTVGFTPRVQSVILSVLQCIVLEGKYVIGE